MTWGDLEGSLITSCHLGKEGGKHRNTDILMYLLGYFFSISNLMKKKKKPVILVLVVAQSVSHVWLFATSWTVAFQAPLSYLITQSLLKFMSIVSVMLSEYLILCHLVLLQSSIFPIISVFSNESAPCIRCSNYWSFSFSNGLPITIQGWFPLG